MPETQHAVAIPPEPDRWERLWRGTVPTLVLSVSLAASFYGHALLRDRAEDRAIASLRLDTAAMGDALEDRAARAEHMFQAVSAFFHASQTVSAEEFASFVILVHASGNVRGVDFISYLPANQIRAGQYAPLFSSGFDLQRRLDTASPAMLEVWRETIDRALSNTQAVTTLPLAPSNLAISPSIPPDPIQSDKGVLWARAVSSGEQPGEIIGVLAMQVDITRMAAEAFEPWRLRHGLRLSVEATAAVPAVLERNLDRPAEPHQQAGERLGLFGQYWRLETWGLQQNRLSGDALLAKLALGLGIAVSLILFGASLSQKRARIQADQARRRLFDALNSMRDGFAVFDAEDRLLLWNDKFLTCHPSSAGSIRAGLRYADLLREGLRQGEYAIGTGDGEAWLAAHLAARVAERPDEVQLQDGRWLRCAAFRTSDGGRALLCSDVTEAKQHEHRLASQLEILEHMAGGSRLAELLGEVIGWLEDNLPGALGSLHRLDANGKRFASSVCGKIPPDYAASLDGIEIGPEVGSCGTAAFRREIVISAEIASDPLWRNFSGLVEPYGLKAVWSAPIMGDSGQVHGTLAAYFKQPRRPSESELKMLRLAATMARLALEREAYLARLTNLAKLEAVDRLSGGIAHDFNNLLQVVEQSTALLRKSLTDERQRSLADMTLEAAGKGAALIKRLLVFARGQPLQLGGIDLAQTIHELEPLLRQACGNIDISLALDDGVGSIRTDRIMLESALLNLTLNARDAMPEGGALRIALEQRNFSAGDSSLGLAPGHYAAISVADTGTGMDAETLRNAVVPYFTTKPVGSGSGLGLSMAYGFARESGGALQLESQPGQGTVVTLYLPIRA
ncbi:PAS-domain containing protein [Ferrovibrio sp.]|uniref:PAS-domain containing protein n=1 Tax=Ferrovibrio sp. TaxID=1917215 RepID=UPI003D0C8CA7